MEIINIVPWVFKILALLIAITVHEFAHAFATDKLGDPTPRIQGRVTLNPLKHLDIWGTLSLLILGFGWGKPVPFDAYNLKNKRRDTFIIGVAGVATNLIVAIIAGVLMRVLGWTALTNWGGYFLATLVSINIMLMVFNLIPIYPLDGNHLLTSILPPDIAYNYQRTMTRFGPILLFILIFPFFSAVSPIQYLISPIINGINSILIPF